MKHGAEVVYAGRSLSYAVQHGRWDVARALLRHGVIVWEHNYQWSDLAPLGGRSAAEIEAWVAAGKADFWKCREEDLARRFAARERMLQEDA